jgi:FixJ family two-component response regulator
MIADPILLVDDEADLRASLVEALTKDGYRVEEAPDVDAALALMATRHYPVVLTDLNMPGGPTGFDLIEAVKAHDPLTLCVVFTGFASMDTAIQAVKFGAYDFVQKPFKLAELEAVLDRALDHAAVMGQLQHYRKDLEDRVVARVQELRNFHEEVLKLNDLLVASQGEVEEGPLFEPFLAHLRARFAPTAGVTLLPASAGGWERLGQFGLPPWDQPPAPAGPLPPPASLDRCLEWQWRPGFPEGYLIPLVSGGLVLGAIYLGFQERNAFDPADPVFVLWRRQLEAALHGLRRTRDQVGIALVAAYPLLP